ncbi:hypothetical protein ACFY3G_35080 [Streptomyces phaeochromogenes]|uniref:hypothetical protein n=1 Tax=Streptomyces phaeochromogenes TaxID=1923 RepID=UPI00369F9AE1
MVDKADGVGNQGAGGPVHWGDDWSRMPVYRAGLIDHKGEEQQRKPLFLLPENIKGHDWRAERDRGWSATWWGGVGFTLDEARNIVEGTAPSPGRGAFGRYPGAAKDIAHLMWHDDMFVIDCDIKAYCDSPDGTPFIANGNVATIAKTYTRYGLDDLYREAQARGMYKEELDSYLETWTESTKSGGCHIVLRQNPDVRIPHTFHHKHEYRVDVLQNNWRACYPTPGYTVRRGLPVKVAAKRLVELLIELNRSLDPVGGKRMMRLDSAAKMLHRQVYTQSGTVRPEVLQDRSLMDRWRLGVLRVVHEADQVGNWNKRIFWAACRYAEGGWAQGAAERDILAAAQPWGSREERQALDSINSAYNNVARKGAVR